MDLREYLFRKRMTTKEFAEKLEYSRTHLTLILNGKSRPSKRLAKDIERLTDGEVTVADLLEN